MKKINTVVDENEEKWFLKNKNRKLLNLKRKKIMKMQNKLSKKLRKMCHNDNKKIIIKIKIIKMNNNKNK